MAGISGLGSGIDIDSIVRATVAAERAPKDAQLARQESSSTAKFTALGTLKGALSEFQSALKSLGDAKLYGNSTASSSVGSVVTATAVSSAQAGKYQVEVKSLALPSRVTTAAIDKNFVSEEGALTIGLGLNDSAAVSVSIAAGLNLEQVRDALNEQLKEAGITANIVHDTSSTSRLVFSSTKAGEGKDIVVTGSSGNLSGLSVDGAQAQVDIGSGILGAGQLQKATDAIIVVDGIEVRSQDNQAKDVIPGVTLKLLAVSEAGKSATVTVGNDITGVTSSIKKFVESYNKLIETANSLSAVTPVEGSTPIVGNLVGDSTLRSLLGQVRSELGTIAGGSGGIKTLSALGIATEKDGKLKINEEKLGSALKENFSEVGGFLAGENGLMSRLDKRVSVYTQTDGILDQRMKGQRAILDSVKEQREALERRIASTQARLYAQYNAMDSLVGQLTRTSDWMVGAFESLPGVTKKK